MNVRPIVLASALAGAVVVGAVVGVQPRINGELALALDDGFLAALISFGTGTIVLLLVLAVWPAGRRGFRRTVDAIREKRMSPWFLVSGFAGAFAVLSQGLTATVIGVALFTVAVVGGQALSSLLLDRRGLGTMASQPLTLPRVGGAVLATVAVAWAVSDRIRTDVPWWVLVMPVIAGAVTAWQQAANGQLRERSGSVLTASIISFIGGTAVLGVATVIEIAIAGPPQPLPHEPWLYTGGLLGIGFIAGSAALIRYTGVLLFGLATIAGQLVVAVAIDAFFPVAGVPLSASTVAAAALALLAVGIATLGRRIRAPRGAPSP